MEALKLIPYIVLVVCISAVIAGACAITLGNFSDTTTDTSALEAINNGSQAISDIAEQLPTVGIIGVMVIIIALISGVFVYMRYFA